VTISATMQFQSFEPHLETLNTAENTMVARIFFSLQLADKQIGNLFVDATITGGESKGGTSIEVGTPQGLPGIIPQGMFEDAVESYCRKILGSATLGIRVEKAEGVVARPHRVDFPMSMKIQFDVEGGGW
jgi:hypothetical protein